MRKPRTGEIKAKAIELLCAVDYYEDKTLPKGEANRFSEPAPNRVSVGFPYRELQERMIKAFPDCRCNIANLRGYAVKIRSNDPSFAGYKLPYKRPRR